jgi:hypothetical protein
MARYITGLVVAFLVFGLTCVLSVAPIALGRGQPALILQSVSMWAMFGIPNVIILAVIVGPAVLIGKRVLGPRLSEASAVGFGAIAGLSFVLLFWLAYRETDESIVALLRFWVRVPGELLIGTFPHIIASGFFGGWLAAREQRPWAPWSGTA